MNELHRKVDTTIMRKSSVAVDVGGTFTDICLLDEATGGIHVTKVPSTVDPIEGVLSGVEKMGIGLESVALLWHATTIATNSLITRSFPPAAMVTTRGFRDVLEIRRGVRQDLWDAYKDVAPPYIRRRDRLVVSERIDYSGRIVEPLDEGEMRHIAAILRRRNIHTVAVCFINSFANPVHEQRAREILEAEVPDVVVSTSSEILPELSEHERFSTTVANAVLAPLVGEYLRRLERELQKRGYGGDLLILHSGGGVMTPRVAERFAVRLAGSGIAAGAIGSRYIGSLCGYRSVIGLDMGGTSADISLSYDGEINRTREWFIEFGYPIRFPSIEVLTIGAGGGSVAWIDDGGSLRNGPGSAGSSPGPACYGLGNEQPTNTDANLVLGRLGDELIGGEMRLDQAAAERAIRTRIAEPLGLEVVEAAAAIIEIANANMADALRVISVRRGYDPREFALVVFGGAGPLHGVELARELSIPTVLVPPSPGVTSAFGCLLVDVRHDFSAMFIADADVVSSAEVERAFARLESEARVRLEAEGIAEKDTRLERTIDMRYRGQWRSLTVRVGRPLLSLEDPVMSFHQQHEREHNYRRDGVPVEIYRLNVTALGVTPKAKLMKHGLTEGVPRSHGTRWVVFHEVDLPVETPVFRRSELAPGMEIRGPAVVEQVDSTLLIPPAARAEVDAWLNVHIHVSEGA